MKKLKLNKNTIASLNEEQQSLIKGGAMFSQGCPPTQENCSGIGTGTCSDGCSHFYTYWNCTKTDCTNDCATVGAHC